MMPMRMLVVLMLCGALCAAPAAAEDRPPTVSQAELQDRIAQSRGTPLMVVYWASWCAPCRRYRAKADAVRGRYPESRLHMLGVSLDANRDRAAAYLTRQPLPYPTVFADTALIAARLGKAVPTTVLYRRDGTVERELIGDVSEKRLDHYIRRIVEERCGTP